MWQQNGLATWAMRQLRTVRSWHAITTMCTSWDCHALYVFIGQAMIQGDYPI